MRDAHGREASCVQRIMYETFSAPDIDSSPALSPACSFFVCVLPHHVCAVCYRTMRPQMHLSNAAPKAAGPRAVYLHEHLGQEIPNNLLRRCCQGFGFRNTGWVLHRDAATLGRICRRRAVNWRALCKISPCISNYTAIVTLHLRRSEFRKFRDTKFQERYKIRNLNLKISKVENDL